MQLDELDYPLDPAQIAQRPTEPRDAARLLIDRGPSRPPHHGRVADLPAELGPGDLVVVNDTRVRRARLRTRKPTGGAVEVLLLVQTGPETWEAMVGANRPVPAGTELEGRAGTVVTVGADLGGGRRIVHCSGLGDPPDRVLEQIGDIPLPPYIRAPLADPERYQTVYARRSGSVAAPTAGLHLTPDVLAAVEATGARVVTLDLTVGYATFKPIATARVDDHHMHAESYDVPAATWEACDAATRVVAVGTTTTRALETVAAGGPLRGSTELFIAPGYEFRVVDVLLTNFHMPRSSLLALLSAFIGPRWRALYATAAAHRYGFGSFGDATLVRRAG